MKDGIVSIEVGMAVVGYSLMGDVCVWKIRQLCVYCFVGGVVRVAWSVECRE